MFESEFESERLFRNFQSSILTSFFRNFRKVWNRTNSEYSVNSECSETPVFDPNLLPNYFCKIFASLKKLDISKKFPNFDNRTIPKLAKTKSLENSVFQRALISLTSFVYHTQKHEILL